MDLPDPAWSSRALTGYFSLISKDTAFKYLNNLITDLKSVVPNFELKFPNGFTITAFPVKLDFCLFVTQFCA